MVLRVKTCICGASLRAGTLLIGYLDCFAAFILLVVASIGAVNYRSYRPWWEGHYPGMLLPHPMDDLQGVYVTMAVTNGILMVIDVLLLIGIYDTKPKLIIPWIYFSYVSVLSNVVCALTYGVYCFTYYYEYYGYASVGCSAIYLVFKIYFLLVIWSFYNELKKTVADKKTNVRVQPQPFPNGPQTYPNGQPMYPNGQMQYPNQPQPFPLQFYPNPQPLPSMENMNRDV